MFDIDHFKLINDKHGHLTGDYVLREMSKRLLGRVRREELLARYGGEEFAAVLPETDLTGGRTFGEQLRRIVADTPFEYEGDSFTVTVSVGHHDGRGHGHRRLGADQARRRQPVQGQARGPQSRDRLAGRVTVAAQLGQSRTNTRPNRVSSVVEGAPAASHNGTERDRRA